MKCSIAKYIWRMIIIVTLAVAGITVMFSVREARKDAYDHAQLETYSAAETLSMRYSHYEEDILHNDAYADHINEEMQKLIEQNDLQYMYIVVTDRENETIEFCYIEGAADDDDTAATVNKVLHETIRMEPDKMQELNNIMEGKSTREDAVVKNKYSHVVTTYVPLYDSNESVIAVIGADVSVETVMADLLKGLPKILIAKLLVGAASALLLYFFMQRKVIRPVQEISNAMEEFGKNGSYSTPDIPIGEENEFGLIKSSFERMAGKIREDITSIREYTEIQSRQAYELDMASKIQQGLLPAEQYEDGDKKISACMLPAKSVGGDFYDYFEHNGCEVLVLADVSGKGLGGAIFMASAISLVRGFVKQNLEPDEVLLAVNRELEHANPSMMFVTLFLAYIDTQNGLIRYSNAGHNPPYVLHNGRIQTLNAAGSLPLGIFEEESYVCSEESFLLGSTLYLYTDGVNEAVNKEGEFFGIERLERILRGWNGENVITTVQHELEKFTAGCEQSDDITMLTFSSKAEHITLLAEEAAYVQLKEWILKDPKIPEEIRNPLCLMAEEIFINIASYAYDNRDGKVVVCKQIGEDRCILQFADNGKPFDQSSDVIDIDEYDPFDQPGGLGRFLVQSLSDEWRYVHFEDQNVLMLMKKWNASKESGTNAE